MREVIAGAILGCVLTLVVGYNLTQEPLARMQAHINALEIANQK